MASIQRNRPTNAQAKREGDESRVIDERKEERSRSIRADESYDAIKLSRDEIQTDVETENEKKEVWREECLDTFHTPSGILDGLTASS